MNDRPAKPVPLTGAEVDPEPAGVLAVALR